QPNAFLNLDGAITVGTSPLLSRLKKIENGIQVDLKTVYAGTIAWQSAITAVGRPRFVLRGTVEFPNARITARILLRRDKERHYKYCSMNLTFSVSAASPVGDFRIKEIMVPEQGGLLASFTPLPAKITKISSNSYAFDFSTREDRNFFNFRWEDRWRVPLSLEDGRVVELVLEFENENIKKMIEAIYYGEDFKIRPKYAPSPADPDRHKTTRETHAPARRGCSVR